MIFVVAFLGALFAIMTSLLIVYTYVMLRAIPRLKKGLHEFVEEIGPRALFERSGVDPQEAMRELGIDVVVPRGAAPKVSPAKLAEQHRAEQIIEALVARGCGDYDIARELVWRCRVEDRASIERWMAAAHDRWQHAAAAFEHEFDGDGADCAVCHEGRMHYLHRESRAADVAKERAS